ncbi:MAG: DUF4340 domain-containing protein [Sandaracinaceae bacterium]
MGLNRYRIVVGVVVLLVMAGLAYWTVSSNTGDTPVVEEELPELPELTEDEITEVTIVRQDDEGPVTIRFRRADDGETWHLLEPLEARASGTAVDDVLRRLTGLEVRGVAARSAEQHERLMVDDGTGIHVIAKGGDETLADLWIGQYRSPNTMIRVEGDDTVLMTPNSIRYAFARRPNEWRDRTITDLATDDIREATFRSANGTFRFVKADGAWTQVTEPLEEGGEELEAIEGFDPDKVQSHLRSLARVSASSFPEEDLDAEQAGLGEGAAVVSLVVGEGDEAQTVRIIVGGEKDEESSQRYVRRDGDEQIYIVSRYLGERLMPEPSAFQEDDEEEDDDGDETAAAMPPPPPGGAPSLDQLPPEVQEQIRQLQKQQR